MAKVALVFGASGIVGHHLCRELSATGWQVKAIMKRHRDLGIKCEARACDLTDRECLLRELKGKIEDATHMFYCALQAINNKEEEVRVNSLMFRNALEVTETYARSLHHVFLMEGTKWYGCHLGPDQGYTIPSGEDDPRLSAPIFYYSQEDWLRERQAGKQWTWSAARPHGVVGFSTGSAMNLGTTLAAYATVLKESGQPLIFPGGEEAYRRWRTFCDAELLARAIVWMATTEHCKNQAFNVDNGDYLAWRDIWPEISYYFRAGMIVPRDVQDIDSLMKDGEKIWESMQMANRLKPIPLKDLATWDFFQFYTTSNWNFMSDLSKLRKFGFSEHVDTKKMFMELFDRLRKERVIPGNEEEVKFL